MTFIWGQFYKSYLSQITKFSLKIMYLSKSLSKFPRGQWVNIISNKYPMKLLLTNATVPHWWLCCEQYHIILHNDTSKIRFCLIAGWHQAINSCINVIKLGHHCFRQWLVACLAPSHYLSAAILLIGAFETNFSEVLIEISTSPFKKMHLKMLSWKWRPFCLGLNVFDPMLTLNHDHDDAILT